MEFVFELLFEIICEAVATVFLGTAESTMSEKTSKRARIILASVLAVIFAAELAFFIISIAIHSEILIIISAILLIFYVVLILAAFLKTYYNS